MKAEANHYWNKIISANASLANPSTMMRLESKSFEAQIRKAFEAGWNAGFRKGHEVGKLAKVTEDEKSMLDNLFGNFGD